MSAPARTLWEISDDLAALEVLLLAAGGEITEEEAEAEVDRWLGALAETKAERDAKIDDYIGLIRALETRATLRERESAGITEHAEERLAMAREQFGINAIEAEAMRVDQLADRDRQAVAALESRLLAFFQLHGHKTLETLRFRITAAKHGGKRALKITGDVPLEFQRQEWVVDKEMIRAALEEGIELPFAVLEERGSKLKIT